MTEASDALWAPLRDAVPTFDATWREYAAEPRYDPGAAGVNIIEFTDHLQELVRKAGPSAVTRLLAAMEDCYAWAASQLEDAAAVELERLMTISILERLICATEEAGHDLRSFASLLPGPHTRAAWERALAWTHPECAWDWERGLVFHVPPPRSLGRFRVSSGFVLSARDAIVMQGTLLEGRVAPGNLLRLRLSAGSHIEAVIGAVEWIRTDTGEELGLVLPFAPDADRATEEAMWSSMEGETLEVAEPRDGSPMPHN